MQAAALLSEVWQQVLGLTSTHCTWHTVWSGSLLHSFTWLHTVGNMVGHCVCLHTGAHGWPHCTYTLHTAVHALWSGHMVGHCVYTLGHMVGHPRLPIQPLWNLSCCRRPTHPQFLLRNTNTFWNTNTFDKYKSLGCWFSPCITWTNLELISPQKFLGVDWIKISYFKAFCYLILGDGVWSSALINTPAG